MVSLFYAKAAFDGESAPSSPTIELSGHGGLPYVVILFRLVADPPAYLGPGRENQNQRTRERSVLERLFM